MTETIQGSCLCGGVRFEVTLPFRTALHCHCSRCRKHSGTFGLTQGRVPRERFRLLQGEHLIRVFHPGEGKVKAFCSTCGSSLFGGDWPDGDEVSIRLGSLDDDPEIGPRPTSSSIPGRRGTSSRTTAYHGIQPRSAASRSRHRPASRFEPRRPARARA
ncbi:MAG TPA: GFA family protein [Gaiellaceae bacterium]